MKFALLALVAWSGSAFADVEKSCADAPSDAVLVIPKPVDEWARVSCTESGHIVTFTPSYGWFSHKSKKLISFRAQAGNDNPRAGKHDFYFTRIEVEKHSEAISKVLSGAFMPEIYFSFTGYDVPAEIPVMYDVTFVTNKGQRLGLNFFVYGGETFGNACWENCVPIDGFAVVRKPIAQVPKEKTPEFIAAGLVVTFDEICLKIYSDYAKANEWMKGHSRQENTTSSADAYREEKADRVFLVGSPLASYVVAFGAGNRCTVYSEPAEKKTAERLLNELMNGYAAQWKTTFEQTENRTTGREHVVSFMANMPGTDKPILGIMVGYISTQDEANPLIKVTGVSLKRLQTSQQQQSVVPK